MSEVRLELLPPQSLAGSASASFTADSAASAGAIALLRLRRPEKRNVFNRELIAQAHATVDRLARLDDVSVAVLTGEGASFCAGADVVEMRELTPETAADFIRRLHELLAAIRDAPQVVIAAVNGHALGAGCELIAACDLRIAATDAVFGMPEIRVGIPSVIEAALLVPLVGLGRAAEMVYTGATLTAAEARAIGLVNQLVAPESLLDEALARARELAAFSPTALRLQKRLVRSWAGAALDAAVEQSIPRFADAFRTPDARAAMAAFLERRRERGRSPTS
jgi:enoyl-CoA hydratase